MSSDRDINAPMEAPLGEEANHEEEAGMMHSEEQQGETSSHGDVAGLPEGDIDLDADSIGEEVGDEDIDPGDDDWELNDTLLDLTGFVPQYRDLLTSMQDNDLLALQEAILNYQYRYRNDMWQYDIVYKKGNAWGYNIVGFAVLLKLWKLMKYLVEEGADVGKPADKDGLFAVMPIGQAAWDGHRDIVEYLYHIGGADLNETVEYGESSLSWACTRGEESTVRFLLQESINLNAQTEVQQNALMNSCSNGNVNIIRLLIAFGLDANAVKLNEVTPLMIAAEQGHVDAVKYLLSLPGIDVNKQEQISQLTALHFAISHMYKDVVQILCEHGANVHLRIVNGLTAFLHACGTHDCEMVKFLVEEAHANVHDVEDDGCTGLMIACLSHATPDLVSYLLSKGININAATQSGQTALTIALNTQQYVLAKLLIVNGADVNTQNTAHKRTALAVACTVPKKSAEVLEFIRAAIEQNANIHLEDLGGKTARHYAIDTGDVELFDEWVAMYAKHPTDYFSSMIRASLEQDDKFYHIPEFIVVAYIYYKLVYLKQLVHWKVKRRIDNNETTDSSSSSSDGENSKAYLHALDSVMDLRKEINQIETRFELLLAYGKTSINYQNICPTDAISQARYLHSMLAMYRNRATRACGSQHALKMEHYTIEELDEAIKNDVIGVKLAPINALVQELEDQIHFMVNYESKKFEEQTREATTESSNEVNSAVKTDPAPIQMLIPRKKHKES